MKIRKIIPKAILIVFFSLILILWPITFLSLNDSIWLLIQKRNGVTLSEDKIELYNHQIVSFFKDGNRNLDFLTQEEFSHMQDVKNLITKANLLFAIGLILFLPTLVYLGKTKFVKTVIKRISFFVLLLLFLSLIISIISFTGLFLGFHKIFFVGNYMFPSTSMLKILYPDNFFRDIFVLYFILATLGCLATLVISYKLKV